MADNVREFPQAYRWDEDGLGKPSFHVISVPSSVGQVKIVPDIIKDREDCAVVLPDEHLLMPLLDSIPPEIEDITLDLAAENYSLAIAWGGVEEADLYIDGFSVSPENYMLTTRGIEIDPWAFNMEGLDEKSQYNMRLITDMWYTDFKANVTDNETAQFEADFNNYIFALPHFSKNNNNNNKN